MTCTFPRTLGKKCQTLVLTSLFVSGISGRDLANICGVSGKLVLSLLSGAVALRSHAVDCVSSLVLREVICLSLGSLFVFLSFHCSLVLVCFISTTP